MSKTPRIFVFGGACQAFDAAGALTDEKQAARVKGLGASLARHLCKMPS